MPYVSSHLQLEGVVLSTEWGMHWRQVDCALWARVGGPLSELEVTKRPADAQAAYAGEAPLDGQPWVATSVTASMSPGAATSLAGTS